jgi:cephalosporin-C deacetylase-like acetyl esterase
MLTRYLTAIAEKQWDERAKAIAAIRTPADVAKRQAYARSRILESFGGFPKERAPLRARIVGAFDREGYRVERLIYESLPEFYVTANVYVPLKSKRPFPAVLLTAGHSGMHGKDLATNQQLGGSLARRGILALAYDPIGAGERLQYYDPEMGRSLATLSDDRGTSREHMMADWPCRLTGGSFARYEIWDGVRAVDYLLTRNDVDPKRIGVTGWSGGGTQAALLAAVEPRLAAAASVNYMTKWDAMWTYPGPRCAEHLLTNFIGDGLDFGDLAILMAPRPFSIVAGKLDALFPIEGARATAAEVRGIYEILGKREAAGFWEDDRPHAYWQGRREEAVRWMQRWLNDRPDDQGREPEMTVEPEEALNCTPTGHLSTSLKGKTVHLLNRAVADVQFAERTATKITDPAKMRSVIAKRIGVMVKIDGERVPPPVSSRGAQPTRSGHRIEDIALETESGITVPAVVLVPERGEARKPAILLVDSAGKPTRLTRSDGRDREERWDGEAMAEAGFVVMAADLRGWGESFPAFPVNRKNQSGYDGFSIEHQTAQWALLLGKTMVGMQVDDLLRAFDYLASRPDVDPRRISLFGKGDGGTVVLYAAALEPRIQKVVSEGAVSSYMAVTRWKYHRNVERLIVPGVLKDFDLPDLVAIIAPRPAWIVSPVTPTRVPAAVKEVSEEYAPALSAFKRAGAADSFRVINKLPAVRFEKLYDRWLFPASPSRDNPLLPGRNVPK